VITYQEALKIILDNVGTLEAREEPLGGALAWCWQKTCTRISVCRAKTAPGRMAMP
jgi:hypothetical protein